MNAPISAEVLKTSLALLPVLAVLYTSTRSGHPMRLFSRRRKASKDCSPRKMIVQDSRLLELPDEILVNIVAHLEYESLLDLRAVSSHLRALADPFVYNDYTVSHGNKASQLDALITARPERACWVRSLLVSTKFEQDAALRFLPDQLKQMRNLRNLVLETPDCNLKAPSERVRWTAIQRAYESILQSSTLAVESSERLLGRLETCTMHLVDDYVSLYPLTKYSSIFVHPTLKSLTISCACTDFPERILAHYRRFLHCTALEHLHLEECDIDPRSLEIILKFPQDLKSFKLSEGTRYDDVVGGRQVRMHGDVNPGALSTALTRAVAHSLETLSLSLGYRISAGLSINSPGRSLNLTSMEHLRKLSISLTSLSLVYTRNACDHQTYRRLPRSLETLHIFTIPLLALHGRPPVPLKKCLYQRKAAHGVPNLRNIIYTYEYQTPIERTSFGMINRRGSELFRRIVATSKERVRRHHLRQYRVYRKHGIRMMVELEATPPGFIPPYLHIEESPVVTQFWDSEQLGDHRYDAQLALNTQSEKSAWEKDEEEEEEDDNDSDDSSEGGFGLVQLAPQPQDLFELLVMQPGHGMPM